MSSSVFKNVFGFKIRQNGIPVVQKILWIWSGVPLIGAKWTLSSVRLFLLRDSQSNPRAFVLTLCHHQKIKHFQILPVSPIIQHGAKCDTLVKCVSVKSICVFYVKYKTFWLFSHVNTKLFLALISALAMLKCNAVLRYIYLLPWFVPTSTCC